MIKMIDRFTGVDMWVAEEKVEKYKEAGHKLASEPEEPKKPTKKGTRKAR